MTAGHAAAEDIRELAELRLLYLEEDLGALTDKDAAALRERLPGYFRAHLGRDLFAYVAREGGQIAACALLLVTEMPMSPRFPNGRTGTVLNVYTRPECRRRGHGRAVMEALLADASEMRLSRVELKATAAGAPLYAALGFRDSAGDYRLMQWTDPR